jgi:predicted  nucleic acid-binding Zn-ribbon protein
MTSFKCKACGDQWTEGVTRDHREDQECRNCSRGRAEILTAFYKSSMDRAEAAERTVKSLSEELEAEVVETDALKSRLVESNNRVKDNEIQITRMAETIRRYKKAMGQIHSKLSVTRVPSQKWVKTLHGELFVIAHFELEE